MLAQERNKKLIAHAASVQGAAPEEEEEAGDPQMMFAKLCEDQSFLPIFSVFQTLMDHDIKGVLYFTDFEITSMWAKVIVWALEREKEFKKYVKKLILNKNNLKDSDFSKILLALLGQEGLDTIIYKQNEIGPESIPQLYEFLYYKNVDHFCVYAPINMTLEVSK